MWYGVLAALSVGLSAGVSVTEHKKSFRLALLLKTTASVCFFALGALAFLAGKAEMVRVLILTGLGLGAIGDVLLIVRRVCNGNMVYFYIGGTSFFIGHLLYIIAFMPGTEEFLPAALIIGLTVGVAITLLTCALTRGETVFRALGLCYLTVVSVMASLAVFGTIRNGFATAYLIRAIGAVLFLASDTALFFRMMKDKEDDLFLGILVLITYYPAQCLIALSILFLQ